MPRLPCRFFLRGRGAGDARSARRGPPITTGRGDTGFSRLADGTFLPKNDPRFEALGDIDELSCVIGLARQRLSRRQRRARGELRAIQQQLQLAMGIIAAVRSGESGFPSADTPALDIEWLDTCRQAHAEQAQIEPRFILPGDAGERSGRIAYCRAITRRCERSVTTLLAPTDSAEVEHVQRFLNRLSDYFFVLARRLEGRRR